MERRPDILLISTADWDNPFWTNKQHVACELARLGHRILYVESLALRPPTGAASDLRRILKRVIKALRPARKVRPNVWVLSPLVIPNHRKKYARTLNRLILSISIYIACISSRIRPAWLWTYSPISSIFLNPRKFESTIYHCVDDISAQPNMPRETIVAWERELASAADIVFVTSRALEERLISINQNTKYYPNVVEYEHFARAMEESTSIPEDVGGLKRPIVGFVGAISAYKVDVDLIKDVASMHPEWTFVFIGQIGEGDPRTDVGQLLKLPNVHLIGPRTYTELPAYLKSFDVAIIPSPINEYTTSMFPMKFFEYMAAGKAVVTTDLPALQEYGDVSYLAANAEEFSNYIARSLAGDVAPLQRRLSAASQQTYRGRTGRMLRDITDSIVTASRRL